jgi:hypothetical protein
VSRVQPLKFCLHSNQRKQTSSPQPRHFTSNQPPGFRSNSRATLARIFDSVSFLNQSVTTLRKSRSRLILRTSRRIGIALSTFQRVTPVRVCSKQLFTFLAITAIMAPLPESSIKSYLSSLFKRTPSPQPSTLLSDLSPKAAALVARAQNILPRDANPGAGVTPPTSIPNKLVFVVFGLIGLGFVVTGIWFFFWAKNGGFYFKENDWDDYKSTVVRRGIKGDGRRRE